MSAAVTCHRCVAVTASHWSPIERTRSIPRPVPVSTPEGQRLGYVPDLLLEHLRTLGENRPRQCLTVEHVNGPEAPAHLRLLGAA